MLTVLIQGYFDSETFGKVIYNTVYVNKNECEAVGLFQTIRVDFPVGAVI